MALVYLDSCVFIAAFEAEGSATAAFRRLLVAIDGRARAITSEFTLAELLAPIAREGSLRPERRRAMYMPLLEDETFIRLMPVTRRTLLDTIDIRSSFHQRLPDAIHMATALASACSHFVSSDRDARRVPPSLTWTTPVPDDIDALIRSLDV